MDEILTDDEIDAIGMRLLGAGYGGNTDRDLARAVERAVVEKLAMGGELPDPTVLWQRFSRDSGGALPIYAYTDEQMREMRARGVAAGMAQERARCVAVCEAVDLADDEKEQTR
jgi:hypothetical protein